MILALALAVALTLIGDGQIEAHGIGQRYDLPVPLWLYLYGAAGAVVISFVLVGLFVGARPAPVGYPRLDVLRLPVLGALLRGPIVAWLVRAAGVALFLLTLAASLFGTENPYANLAPTFVWVVWWVGLTYVTALAGDVWRLLNPWRTLFLGADRIARTAGRRRGLDLGYVYPDAWGVWPALSLYAGFVWLEVVYAGAPLPRTIGLLTLVYSAVTWAGMAAFGVDDWLRHADPFSVLFRIVARFAPTELRVRGRSACAACDWCDGSGDCVGCYECWSEAPPADRELALRPWGAGLLRPLALGRGGIAFVVFMLASVSFDGLAATELWRGLAGALQPLATALRLPADALVGSLGLPAVALVFYGAYRGGAGAIAAVADQPVARVAGDFILSLVPIALAYHFAHYYTLLLSQGPVIVPLLSDPFGRGWDLLGISGRVWDATILNAAVVWYSQVGLVIAGHATAVYLGHRIALRVVPEPRVALRSQRPMLGLMVLYTVLSLWILAQPIVSEARP